MTHGSLFSGSGGFDLAVRMCGMETAWDSEIEPELIRILQKNFPEVEQLGDISMIDGAKIQPVDVISGGSPCQDMSVAGKREGLDGRRSTLFHEQIRIVKEMRRATNGEKPRYMVWENVPGAFSSNGGEDFRCVLEETCRIAHEGCNVPRPEKGRWGGNGAIVGNGFSVAWRLLDAQYWGIPQRRSRVYLVADFGGTSAPQILFEREGLRRDFKESRETGQGAAGSPEGGSDKAIVLDNHAQDSRITIMEDGVVPTLTGKMGTGGGNVPLLLDDQGGGRISVSDNGISPALRAQTHGHPPNVMEPIPINDKATRYRGGGDTRSDDGSGNGLGIGRPGDPANTITATDRHAVAYGIDRAAFNQGENAKYDFAVEEELQPTMLAKGPGAVGTYSMQGFGDYKESDKASAIKTRDYKDSTDLVAEDSSCSKYIVRRLTPLECCRLQGFPDDWADTEPEKAPSAAEVRFWSKAWLEWWAVVGRSQGVQAPKNEKAIRRWLKKTPSDTTLYKMWGNGLALPCALYVFEGIALQINSHQIIQPE